MARVAIVGCGAMGSVYAGLMADAGHEVFAVTLWPDHAQAMRENGLRVEGASGDRLARVHASTSTDGIGPCDLVVIATKAFDVEAAARSTLPLLARKQSCRRSRTGSARLSGSHRSSGRNGSRSGWRAASVPPCAGPGTSITTAWRWSASAPMAVCRPNSCRLVPRSGVPLALT